TPQEVCGTSMTDYVYPEEVPAVMDRYNRRLDGEDVPHMYESVLQHKDGSRVEVEINVGQIPYDGGIANLIIVRDITERKKVEIELKESERKYRDLAEMLPQTVFEVNEDGIATYVNRHGLVTFGYTRKDLGKGINVLDLFAPEDRQKIDRRMKGRWHGKTSKNNEYVAITKDGSTMPIMVYTSLVMGEDGPIGLRGIVLDITERKQAEEALRESEEKYRLVTENINDLIAMVDMEGNYLYANEAHRTIGGYNPGDLLGKNSLEYLHPEDYERVLETFTAASDQRESDIEVRYRCADGAYRWVQSHSRVLTNENGIPEKGLMVGIDITERKLAEKALRQSEEKYRNLVEEIKEAMFTLGTDSTVTYTSGAIS
ncbi:MAG: PAS domain S-box protein, partial [Planctomycetes bacterium]|nr:PAS domain S-box protein [Planctomycetota bacterium]